MKNEPMRDERIARALESALSGVAFTENDKRHVLNKLKGEEKMKKKFSFALILALTLILLTAGVALAWSLSHEYFEGVGRLEVQSGYYEDWSFDEKLQMLALMKQYGVEIDEGAVAAAQDTSLTKAEREKALDTFMAEKYGIYGRIDVISLESILTKEKGELYTWSVEDKAWYTDFEQKLGLLSIDEENFYALPTKADMTQEQAKAVAQTALKNAGWTQEKLDACQYYWTLVRHWNDSFTTWTVDVRLPDQSGATVLFPSAAGTDASVAQIDTVSAPDFAEQARIDALYAKYGPIQTWPLAVLHEYMPLTYLLPTADEITPEDADTRARAALLAAYPELTEAALNERLAQTALIETQLGDGAGTRSYLVQYTSPSRISDYYFVYLSANTGEIFKVDHYD